MLFRTNQIGSQTLVFRQGQTEWLPIMKVDLLRRTLIDASNESFQAQRLMQSQKPPTFGGEQFGAPAQDEESESEDEQDEDDYLRSLEENPEKAIEASIDSIIRSKYYKSSDGVWNIYDEHMQIWTKQLKEPVEQISLLKQELMRTLKEEIYEGEPGSEADRSQAGKSEAPGSLKRKASRDIVGLSGEEIKAIEKKRKKYQKQKEKRKQKLKDIRNNSCVYVRGLPPDITEDEVEKYFSKAGMIKIDFASSQKKIKIYTDEHKRCTGDCLIVYQNDESVQIALDMLNEGYIREKNQVSIERAKFDNKGEQSSEQKPDAALQPDKKKIDKIQLMRMKQLEKKALGWEEDDQIKGLTIVIIKGNPARAREVQGIL